MDVIWTNSSPGTNEFREYLAHDWLFILSTVILAVMGPVALVIQLIFLFLLKRHFNIHHANVRLFMWNLAISLLCQYTYYVINAILNILYMSTLLNMSMLTCELINILAGTSSVADICSTFGMGIDRLYATISGRFDDPGRSGWLSKLFVFGSWSIVALINVVPLFTTETSMISTPVTHYCHVLLHSVDQGASIVASLAFIGVEVISFTLPVSIYLINKRQYMEFGLKPASCSRGQNLQQRFALSNNVVVSLMLLPLDALRAIAYIFAMTILVIIKVNGQSFTPRGAVLSSLATCISNLLVFLCPIICIYLDKRLRRAFMTYLHECKNRLIHFGKVTPTNQDKVHFSSTAGVSQVAECEARVSVTSSVDMTSLSKRNQSVVADCVVNFKTGPDNAHKIIADLWKRQSK